jgi:hypothetical protein
MGEGDRTGTNVQPGGTVDLQPDADPLARVRAIPRRGTQEDLARAMEGFCRRMAEPPILVGWETILDAEADRV